jgi:hypothetical protein
MLFASSCYGPEECLGRESEEKDKPDYEIKCNSLASLVADDILEKQRTETFLGETAEMIVSGTAGGITGLVLCTAGAAGISALTGPVSPGVFIALETSCAVGGVYAGAKLSDKLLNFDDKLIAGYKAKDANKVGICTAEESSTFDLGGMLEKIGESIKITGNKQLDGIIIIFGGIFVLVLLMGMLRRK